MKLWYGYGSEHSMNLMMIGHFKTAKEATQAHDALQQLVKQVSIEVDDHTMVIGSHSDRYSERMLALLGKLNVSTISPMELEQFGYDVDFKLSGDEVVLTTEEADVSAFIKVLIDNGARVEIFSRHVYPDHETDKEHEPEQG